MSDGLNFKTRRIKKMIIDFLVNNHKYFGKQFNYDETEYLNVINREVKEIMAVVLLIRGDDAEVKELLQQEEK